jgi:hypothetical protein
VERWEIPTQMGLNYWAHFAPEDGSGPSFQNVVFLPEYQMIDMSRNPVIITIFI